MAKITYSNIDKYCHLDEETFEQQQILEIERLKSSIVKNLVAKQLNTKVNLNSTMENKKQFVSGEKSKEYSSSSSGLFSYEAFKDITRKKDIKQIFIACGLSESQINAIYTDECSPDFINELYEIHKKIQLPVQDFLKEKQSSLEHQSCKSGSNRERQKSERFNMNSSYNESTRDCSVPYGHPINYIKELEKDLFPTKDSKVDRQISKLKPTKKRKLETTILKGRPKTFWDMEEIPIFSTASNFVKGSSNSICFPSAICIDAKTNNCVEQHKLDEDLKKCQKIDYSQTFICQLERNQLIERDYIMKNRLSIDQIRLMEKFKNYDSGTPSDTLYIKNLPRNCSPHLIVKIFGNFDCGNVVKNEYRILSGKMKGQAFVRLSSVDHAKGAIELCNGFFIDKKPMIIEFSRDRKCGS